MPTEDEVQAAQRKLDEAVQEFIQFMEWTADGKLVTTSYVIVASQRGWDDEGESISGYPLIYMNGTLPDHEVLGLLEIGRLSVSGTGRWRRAEDVDGEG